MRAWVMGRDDGCMLVEGKVPAANAPALASAVGERDSSQVAFRHHQSPAAKAVR